VAGSHAGLKKEHVKIVDARTGRFMQVRSDDLLNAGRYMEIKLDAERHAKSKIENALDYIPGVRVEVNAQVDTKEVLERRSTFDEPKVGVTAESTALVTSSNTVSGGEPGVKSNTGANIASSGRNGSQMSNERSETTSVPQFGNTESQIKDAKGYALRINATVSVPKSYFVRLYQDTSGKADEQPETAALDALVQSETEKIRRHITPLIDTQPLEGAVPGSVAVSMFADFGATVMPVITTELVTPLGGEKFLSDSLIKYVSLGGLAAVSLFMMFLMVRKAGAREELPTASELVGIPPALAAAESDLVGEADEASPALEGVELNDDAIRRTQMLDQITEMVQNSPEDAAGLMRRWMRSEAL
jgi:flagellar biosynthesis/type III secretory pathway M-ring protein FliF/YscJ